MPGAAPGLPAPEARVNGGHLTASFGQVFTLLWFGERATVPAEISAFAQTHAGSVQLCAIVPPGNTTPDGTLADADGQAYQRYGAQAGTLYVIRPDGYVLARWRAPRPEQVRTSSPPSCNPPLPEPAMQAEELDFAYTRLCEAMAGVGQDKAPLLLAMVCLG